MAMVLARKLGVILTGATSVAVLCLTGCAASVARPTSGSHTVTNPPRTTSRAVPSSPRTLTTTTQSLDVATTCGERSLTVTYDPSIYFEASGDRGDAFRIANTARIACILVGYPTVILMDPHGVVAPFRYTDGQGQYVTHRQPERVTLEVDGSAYVGIAKYRCDRRDSMSPSRLTMMLPGSARVSVPLSGRARSLDYCVGGPGDPGNTVAISPVEPTPYDVMP